MSPLKTSDAFIRLLMIYGFTLGLCDTSLIPGSTWNFFKAVSPVKMLKRNKKYYLPKMLD